MSARHILMSALVFFTGAYGVTTAAAEKNSSVTALSEDIPQAVIALQKRLSDLQLVTAPCFPAEVAGIEPLICTDPIKAVCSSEASNDFLRQMSVAQFKIAFAEKVYRQIQAQLGKNPEDWLNEASQKGGPQAMQERTLELVGMSYEVTEKLLFGVLKEKGWSKDAVEKIIDKAKAIEISKISSGDSIHPNRVKTLSNAPWVTSESLKKMSPKDQVMTQGALGTVCGVDGLSSNAFAMPLSTTAADTDLGTVLDAGKPAVFIVCPGLILEAALNDAGIDSITWTIAHELGHMLQPAYPLKGTLKIESPEDQRKVADAEKAYEKAIQDAELNCPILKGCFARKGLFSSNLYLNSCDVDRVTQECREVIRTLAKERQALIDRLTTPAGDKNRDRTFLSCLKGNDLKELNDGLEQIAAYVINVKPAWRGSAAELAMLERKMVLKWNAIIEFEKKWGRKPDSIDLHQHELVADYWASQVMDGMLKELPSPSSRKASLSLNLSPFCDLVKIQSKSTDFEEHPPFKYRIERILSNPGIRSSLGCKSPPPRVWCER